jgi:flagellar motility protein MotE (MotC chaperone)
MRLGGLVKNAKDVLSSDAMSSSKNDAKKAAPIVDSLITDELGDYRAPLELLHDCAEQLAGLREAEARLLGEANRLELEREKALESAAEAEDPDVSLTSSPLFWFSLGFVVFGTAFVASNLSLYNVFDL